MSKITFRADDDLVAQLEGLELSKSEAMREALRAYLETGERGLSDGDGDQRDRTATAIDDVVRERVDELLADRLGQRRSPAHANETQDVNVSITLEGIEEGRDVRQDAQPAATGTDDPVSGDPRHGPQQPRRTQCGQCGERVDDDHVYCPNCGEKATHRLFCECGDELRSDWSFCPGCGRRTPTADVLESN
ncbi:ribbon-helix-helix protein, CopG family [Salinadaptatus halalkaliphilus]|uniref:Ribbon-helix-helix protein, CopG family n=1 Tax=Salinadaptatus halalkaliphilus TaxID=2419781 RepID=A0A4S3TJ61_9EURY|nr:zinc ribbon domain-containing protein [Salinadaptatus halalkaliphilus]THE64099.1 ribbon-helix-helix protein, CopG family [Salinadaptatus halalkaliphilus]